MKKGLTLALLSLMASSTLVGCSNGVLEIELDDAIPSAYVGEEYDFEDIIIKKPGVSYSINAYYQNYMELTEVELPVDGFKFTPVEKYDVSVVVHAKKGGSKVDRTTNVSVSVLGDAIDELLISDGFSGYGDTGIRKELTTESQWLKDGGNSAIEVFFNGNNAYTWGCSTFALDNFRLLDEWKDKTQEDGILKFWVYNPTEYNFRFQLRLADEYTNLVNIDWGHSLNIERVAKPGEWTQVLYPLRAMGMDHTYYKNESGTRSDSFVVKVKWDGTPTSKPTPLYSWQMYVDGIDIVPHSDFPEMDTKCYASAETSEYGWENIVLDTTKANGWGTANARYDRDFVLSTAEQESKSSAYLTFEDTVVKDYKLGYSFMLNTESAKSTEQINEVPTFNHGLLEADFHMNEAITNKQIQVVTASPVNNDWDIRYSNPIDLVPGANGWAHMSFDVAKDEVFIGNGPICRLGFKFVGVNETNKNDAVVHIDNIKFNQEGGSPAVVPARNETLQDGYENCLLDIGWTRATVSQDKDNVCTDNGKDSATSMKLRFNGVNPHDGYGYFVAISPEEQAVNPLPTTNNGKFEMDIKLSDDITEKDIGLAFIEKGSWEAKRGVISLVTPSASGWYHVSIDLPTSVYTGVNEVIRIAITIRGVNDTNKATATAWLDNILFTA